eukprot:225511_1
MANGCKFEWTSNPHSDILDNNDIGPYTVCRTVNKYNIFKYKMHVNRLIDTINYDLHTNGNSPVSPSILHETLTNTLYDGLNAFYENTRVNDHETRIMIYIDVNKLFNHLQSGHSFTDDIFKQCLITHFCHLPDNKIPVRAIIRARDCPFNPKKKDTQWFKQRKVWANPEMDDRLEINEVLMYNPDTGRIMEGLSSSFGVLKAYNGCGCTFCVPSLDMGVLNGTVRSFVIDVLDKYHGIGIAYEAPKLQDIKNWKAAMVMSTTRLVLPIDELYIDVEGHEMDKQCIHFDNDNNMCLQDFEMFINNKILDHSDSITHLFNKHT